MKQSAVKKSTDENIGKSSSSYKTIEQIDGSHDLREAVPGGYIDYPARLRHGGKIFYFNYELAKEMGLIASDHPNKMNDELEGVLLNTFSIVIINEFDIQKKIVYPKKDILPRRYMATRYLQLQHPGRAGKTSGDGRGIWNGQFKNKKYTWDVSSSGTGATCLSPATAVEGKFFKTGDTKVCYGNGYNSVDDGISAAVMSEVLHYKGIQTERTLVIIDFPGGSSINVRASKNLIRPSHFFHHVKQKNIISLKGAINHFIDRQIQNQDWPKIRGEERRLDFFLEQMALRFSHVSAQFESDYVFVWLDWDGDNILADGGIIDYGSVRQFGLFHREYRYDDIDRMSTKLTEQKHKARYIVQTFAQIHSFLKTGVKRNIKKFKKHAALRVFDENFERSMNTLLLKKAGFETADIQYLIKNRPVLIKKYRENFAHFERTQSARGVYNVPDGISSDAIFCMRKCLREIPKLIILNDLKPIETEDFVKTIRSSYAKKKDLKISRYRREKAKEYQASLIELAQIVASNNQKSLKVIVSNLVMRASVLNPPQRLTGDGVLTLTDLILKKTKNSARSEIQLLIELLMKASAGMLPKGTPKKMKKSIEHAYEKALIAEAEGV